MLRLAFDEDFNNDIIRALRRRRPGLELLRVQDDFFSGADDAAVLDWAARQKRVLFSHDVSTITKHAYDRLKSGLRMPGVFEVPQSMPIRLVVEDILLLVECSLEDEWEGQVRYLPLR